MDPFFIETAFELIDFRSFSNLWFWLVLAVAWSGASYRAVGVPHDLARRAAQGEPQAMVDLRALIDVTARRMIAMADAAGPWLVGIAWFVGTLLGLMGFLYRIEFAQALLLLFVPFSLVAKLNLRTARSAMILPDDALPNLLHRHRRIVQTMGIVSIFFTAMWGMWVNMNATVLGP